MSALRIVGTAIAAMLSGLAQSAAVTSIELAGTGKQPLPVRVVSVPLDRAEVRVIYVPEQVQASGTPSRSLDDIAELQMERDGERAWALVSGGFFIDPQTPNGLLRANGLWRSSINRAVVRSSCMGQSHERARLSGVVCAGSQPGTVRILKAFDRGVEQCSNAVQAGPLLVEPDGSVGICRDEPTRSVPAARSAVCITRTELKIFVVETPIHLFPLSERLTRPDMGCRVALNLSGDAQAGLVVFDPKQRRTVSYGRTRTALVSAILVAESKDVPSKN